MSIANVRKWRGMPFIKRGMTVYYTHNSTWGKITSTHGDNLMIRMDDVNFSSNYHPWFELAYYSSAGDLIKDYSEHKTAPLKVSKPKPIRIS